MLDLVHSPEPRRDPAPPPGARVRASLRALLLVGLATGLTAGCSILGSDRSDLPEPAPGSPAVSGPPGLALDDVQQVTSGLDVPWSVVWLRGAVLVSERDTGRILEIADDGTARTVGTITELPDTADGGVMGLAVDDEERLYVCSTGPFGVRIQRFAVTGSAGSLQLGDAETILDELPSSWIHHGGRLAFGPDGMLYATAGDTGDSSTAQDLDVLAGKILRMTPDGEVPDDNPFPGSLVYSYGHRNIEGIAWDDDGTLYAAEFGEDTWDELNRIEPGADYGWPEYEGAGGDPDYVDPIAQWPPSDASPAGLTIVDGTAIIANLRGQSVRLVDLDDPSRAATFLRGEYGRIRSVVEGPDGRLWLTTSNTDALGEPGPDDDLLLTARLTDVS